MAATSLEGFAQVNPDAGRTKGAAQSPSRGHDFSSRSSQGSIRSMTRLGRPGNGPGQRLLEQILGVPDVAGQAG
jgi:hypothetical protein